MLRIATCFHTLRFLPLTAFCPRTEWSVMHSRNIYTTAPNFSELAEEVPALKAFIKSNKQGYPSIDFKDPEALRTLTKALLLRDFSRDVYLPEDRLCPPVAGRLDYVLYVQDVVAHSRQMQTTYGESPISSSENDIVGLDIGTGASAIYPLLYTAIDNHVRVIGTDINEQSLKVARGNVENNKLSERIALLHVSPDAGYFDEVLKHTPHLDFTMCNPPFYVSDEEMQRLTAEKELPPRASCTGAPNEMITQGGEIAFVARMIQESRSYKHKISWCTSLLGRAASIISLVKELNDVGCNNYGLIESSPSHTHRWILLWSWGDIRLPDVIARHLPPSSALTKSLPPPNDLTYYCNPATQLGAASSTLATFLSSLDLLVDPPSSENSEQQTWKVQATYASWTRAARRGHAKSQAGNVATSQSLLLACELSLKFVNRGADEGQVEFKATWKRGLDRQAFDSCFSTCVRKLASAVPSANSSMTMD